MPEHSFPKGFYWGAATSSHQVEGGNTNDWSKWEHLNADRLAKASEQAFASWNPHWEKFRTEAIDPKNYLSLDACDHYHRFEEDFALAQSLGHNAHRFSLEWSRIEPEEGVFDTNAIEHYRSVITSLRAKQIEPFVTLWHWTLPLWLSEKGGVLHPSFPSFFERYASEVIRALGIDIRFVVTLNEPDVYAGHSYLKGAWPPERKSFFATLRALHALILAHRKAYHIIKGRFPGIQVGIAKHNIWFEAARGTLWNRFLKWIADSIWNHAFLRRINATQDFIGLNHYNHHRIDGWFNKNENREQTDFGWEYFPESLYHALIELLPYRKPLYITENGIADRNDALRKRFLVEATDALKRALLAGADVRGYFYWSLLDNFEWDKGYWPRFGLISVDRSTQKRTLRESALLYRDIIKNAS